MTLRISLRDGEKIVVNGAVLRSIGRTDICVENKATILRGREIMTPDDADTPAKQLYFHTMMAYIDGENSEAHHDRIIASLQKVTALLPTAEARLVTATFAGNAARLNHYRALADCRTLIALESQALDQAA